MTNYTHLIRLTPHGPYFFGGENYSDSERRAFYFQKSMALPQQTSLLGLIRYQLLLQNDHFTWTNGREKISDAGKAALLIGPGSFLPEIGQPQSFGIVEQLSPLVLLDTQNQAFHPSAHIRYWDDKKTKHTILHQTPQWQNGPQGKCSMRADHQDMELVGAANYDPKLGVLEGFESFSQPARFLEEKEVFEEKIGEQIGIYKHQTLKHRQEEELSEREGFFKQTYKQLKPEYSFGVYVSLNPSQPFSLTSEGMVFFGKERSAFHLEVIPVEKAPPPFGPPVPPLRKGQQLQLLSDAFLDPAVIQSTCVAGITGTKSFRFMQTETHSDWKYYGNLRKQGTTDQTTISKRFNLMRAGSFLHLRNNLSATELSTLQSHLQEPAFTCIGYNHFQSLS